eukprot:jgi/Picsp_1/6832/NSC_04169-R1_caltractin-like protein
MGNGWKMSHRSENRKRIGRMSRLTGKVIVTAQKGNGDKGNVIEDMDDALKKLGLTRENAKFLLKAWKEAGADNPDSLKRMVKKRGAKQSVSAAMQFGVDSLSAIVAWWSGMEIATSQSLGPFSLAGEFLLYTLAMYLTINATLDIFGLITVGVATRKYSEQSSAMLEAVKKMAGEDMTGLEVVDKARQAVVTVQVLQALDKIYATLSDGMYRNGSSKDFFRDLGAYLVIMNAGDKGFEIESCGLSKDQVANLAAEFALADKDDDGYIDVLEFKQLGWRTGQEMTQEEVEAAVSILDTNKDGVIEFSEFVAWFASQG